MQPIPPSPSTEASGSTESGLEDATSAYGGESMAGGGGPCRERA